LLYSGVQTLVWTKNFFGYFLCKKLSLVSRLTDFSTSPPLWKKSVVVDVRKGRISIFTVVKYNELRADKRIFLKHNFIHVLLNNQGYF